jgi:hypothetical protein
MEVLCAIVLCDCSAAKGKFYRMLCCTRNWNGCTLLGCTADTVQSNGSSLLGCSAEVYIRKALICSDALLNFTSERLYFARMLCYVRHPKGSILLGCSAEFYIRIALFRSDALLNSNPKSSILLGCSAEFYIKKALFCSDALLNSTSKKLYSARMLC